MNGKTIDEAHLALLRQCYLQCLRRQSSQKKVVCSAQYTFGSVLEVRVL
jgi:hypothetical protein